MNLHRIAPRFTASLLAALLLAAGATLSMPAQAEKYQSRLNSLLVKKNDLYLPSRLVLGEDARFVIKAPAGSRVRLFLSTQPEGLVLPSGTPLRVGRDVQEIDGVVPENGVLELRMEMPADAELEGKVVYVDAVFGVSEEAMTPIALVDATGRRTDENALVIVKPVEKGGPMVMPSLPGLSPQLMNQLTTMSDIYSKGDERKKLLDNGSINRDRTIDQNPFINRGLQQGIGH